MYIILFHVSKLKNLVILFCRVNTLYMYEEKNHVLPTKFWILNKDDVDILPLDSVQELSDDNNLFSSSPCIEASNLVINNENTNETNNVEDRINLVGVKQSYEETFLDYIGKYQVFLELPHHICLMICFNHIKERDVFYEDVVNAKTFQVNW